MDLPEDDPWAIGKVVDWIYKQVLNCPEHLFPVLLDQTD